MNKYLILLIFLFFLTGNLTSAGSSSMIHGKVRDIQGKPVIDARILLMDKNFVMQSAKVQIKEDGSYVISQLPENSYTILVLRAGYVPWMEWCFRLDGNDTARIDVLLEDKETPQFVYYDNPTKEEIAGWTDFLKVFNEPPLYSPIDTTEIRESYRFIWSRTFHHPVLIHLEIDKNGEGVVYFKEADGQGGYDLGKMFRNDRISFTKIITKEGQSVKEAISIINNFSKEADSIFWTQPYRIDDGSITLDGASWQVEGRKAGRFHMVCRKSPKEGDKLRHFVMNIMQLFRIRFYYDEVY
jgi:hypothetical protein